MHRKDFLKTGLSILITPQVFNQLNIVSSNKTELINQPPNDKLTTLGGMSIEKLIDFHSDYLLNNYIPNWNRGIDLKYGGFADALAPGQEPDFTKKSMYYQGRALWLFSYLYNNITADKQHLEAAIKGRDFLVNNALLEDFSWVSFLNRKGDKLSGSVDHYGDIYMIMGLTELYKATKNVEDLNIAIQTVYSVIKRLLSPTYQHVNAHGSALEPGTHRLGCLVHLLSVLTPLLRLHQDSTIEMIARYCVRILIERHWLPKHGLFVELLDDQFNQFSFDPINWGGPNLRHFNGWHGIQASFMIMDEALRVNYPPVFRQGMEMGFSTLKKLFIEGKGISAIDNPGYSPGSFKPWNALDDVFVFCLMILEHAHHPLAIQYYNKCFDLYYSNFENYTPKCLLHHPRRFFVSINILNRILKNDGQVTGFLR